MFPKRMRTIETTIIITKSNFERKLSSLSNLPIFDRASREFIDILVSFPVYITIARILPEASTVLAQSVFSSLSDYLMIGELCIENKAYLEEDTFGNEYFEYSPLKIKYVVKYEKVVYDEND